MEGTQLDENRVKYISTMGNTAHTYGNLLATAQKWILDIFPDHYFKTIHVSSKIAHKQILSTPTQFVKKSKPMIIFRPRIEYNEDTFLAKTMIVERMGGGPINSQTPGTVDLNPFLFDPERHIDIQFSQMRRVMYIDVIMIFSTLIQQLNFMDFLKVELVQNRPFDINTHLEAYLPNNFMKVLSDLAGVPIHDEGGSVTNFLNYMNSHSCYPVTYKLAGATGKEEFYRYYPTNIFTTMTELDKDDGESTNQIMSSYRINMTFRLEFWTPSITYLFSPHITEVPKMEIPSDSTLIPVYADVFDFEDLKLQPGWKMYSHATYRLDKPKDSVSFVPILDESILRSIDYHLQNGIPLVNLIDIKVRKQGDLLEYGHHYTIDWNKKEVNFNNDDYGWYTYTIIIAIDAHYINTLIKEIFKLD